MAMDNNKIILISLTELELSNIISNAIKEVMATKQEKELLNFKEVCDFLGIHSSTLNKWKSEGKIPFKKIGKRIFFLRSEVTAALKEAGNYKKLQEIK
jgi:excisionase family DNA binding protein